MSLYREGKKAVSKDSEVGKSWWRGRGFGFGGDGKGGVGRFVLT